MLCWQPTLAGGRTWPRPALASLPRPAEQPPSAFPAAQVRCDCPPQALLDFLLSEAGGAAHASAARLADGRAAEAELLEAARVALGAKHLIRVCASYEQVRAWVGVLGLGGSGAEGRAWPGARVGGCSGPWRVWG